MTEYTVLPYVEYDGSWSIPDSALKEIWGNMVKHGLHKAVFYTGAINDDATFIAFLKSKQNHPYFVFFGETLMCLTWLNMVGYSHAAGHFCIFPEAWGRHSVKIAHRMFEEWFAASEWLKVILGQTPTSNRLAVKFLEKIGMTVIGEIPNIAHDVYKNELGAITVSYKEREE